MQARLSGRCKSVLACLFVAIFSSFPLGAAHASGMATSGQLSVTPDGAAAYTIPIQVPPGTAGMAPGLSLTYNSQDGNGLLGVGWSLGGLSTISRCPQTMPQDGVRGAINYDNNDRYCLDGQRLMVVSGNYGADGAEYRTEIDGFTKIISYGTAGNGPSWFKAWTKSGQILEFGNTADSRIEAQGKPTVRVWAMDKAQDTKGNYFTVSYTEDATNGDYYPSRIDYAGNAAASLTPNKSVQFVYETRPDVTPLYHAGSLIKNAVRMTHVKTYLGTQLVKDYVMSYETSTLTQRSRISSISECDGSGVCLPASTIGYSNSASYSPTGGSSLPSWQQWGASFAGLPLANCNPLTAADVDGDGKTDLVCVYDYGNGTTSTWVQLNQGTSFSPWLQWGATFSGIYPSSCRPLMAVDLNGDGKADLVCAYDYGNGTTTTWVQLSQGNGFSAWQLWSSGVPFSLDMGNCKLASMADVDGDGKDDFVCAYDSGTGATTTWVQLNQGTSFSTWQQWGGAFAGLPLASCKALSMADVNGDGKNDLVCAYDYGNGTTSTWVQLSQGTSFGPWQQWGATFSGLYPSSCKPMTVADVNGDGLADLVCVYDYGSGNTATWVQLSQGNSFSSWQAWSAQTGPNSIYVTSCKPLAVADINGDGKADLVCVYDYGSGNTATWVQLSQGNSFSSWQAWSAQTGPNSIYVTSCKPLVVVDVSGDGKTDLVCAYDNGNGTTTTWVQPNSVPIVDISTSITEGLGTVTSLTYKPLADSTVYTKDSGANAATLPVVDMQMPMYVVSSVSSSNGIGGTLTTNYHYGGLKAEVDGRGSLGFRWMDATQADTGLTTHTEYWQDWPYTGMPSLVTKTLTGYGNGGLLSQSKVTYACLNPVDGSACTVTPGNRYFPYAASSTEDSWDLNGAALPAMRMDSQFDVWGNPTQITTSTSDGYSKTTTNTYQAADTVNWFLGRLTKASVTSTTPATAAQPAPLTMSVTPASLTVNAATAGTASGTLTATVSGGTGPYSYRWTHNSAGASTISNTAVANPTISATVLAGQTVTDTWTVTVTDQYGFTVSQSVNVTFNGPASGMSDTMPWTSGSTILYCYGSGGNNDNGTIKTFTVSNGYEVVSLNALSTSYYTATPVNWANGAKLGPGTYQIKLLGNGTTGSGPITITFSGTGHSSTATFTNYQKMTCP